MLQYLQTHRLGLRPYIIVLTANLVSFIAAGSYGVTIRRHCSMIYVRFTNSNNPYKREQESGKINNLLFRLTFNCGRGAINIGSGKGLMGIWSLKGDILYIEKQ